MSTNNANKGGVIMDGSPSTIERIALHNSACPFLWGIFPSIIKKPIVIKVAVENPKAIKHRNWYTHINIMLSILINGTGPIKRRLHAPIKHPITRRGL